MGAVATIIGGGIGFVVGGPAGAAAGASIGASLLKLRRVRVSLTHKLLSVTLACLKNSAAFSTLTFWCRVKDQGKLLNVLCRERQGLVMVMLALT
jgi:hypothetical protein